MALLEAVKNNDLKEIKLLLALEKGADINIQDKYGWTALMYASRNSNSKSSTECVKLLLDHGADINMQDEYGWKALMCVLLHSNSICRVECIKLLLEKTAKINSKELEILMTINNGTIIRMLLDKYGISNLSEKEIEKYKENEYFKKLVLM